MRQCADTKTAWIVIIASAGTALALVFQSHRAFVREADQIVNDENFSVLSSPGSSAWIEIDFGNGLRRMFEGDLDNLAYPFESALRASARAGGFTYTIRQGKIIELAGVQGSKGQWRVYQNQKPILASLDQMAIKTGDTYTLRYEP